MPEDQGRDPEYRPVRASKYAAMQHALRDAPQADGRFDGEPALQEQLCEQMRELFDDDPGPDVVLIKHGDVLGLADDLQAAEPRWSIGQYSSALASLVKPEGE